MPISIERKTGVPLYIQVRHEIERLLRNGVWENGSKLPTERELALTLGISRNTVSAAYRCLEREGLLSSRQGSGTYVSSGGAQPGEIQARLGRAIDAALDEALAMGLQPADFLGVARSRIEEREEALRRLKVCFVECNREQLDYFSKELELGSGVHIVPVLIDDLRRDGEGLKSKLEGSDLAVTTFFHLDEVRRHLSGIQVIGIALDPLMETIVRLARLPRSRVALVAISVDFAERVMKSIAIAGISHLDVRATTTKNAAELTELLRDVQAVLSSPGRRREVESLAPPGVEVIEFIYRPDAGSIHLLKSVLMERRRERSRKGVPSVGYDRIGQG